MKTHFHQNGVPYQATTALICALIAASTVLGIGRLMANPRNPGPPWPETRMYSESFDQPYRMPTNQVIDATVWAESWSGYCLDRSSSPVVPWVIPMVVTNRLQVDPASGAIRLWYRPAFDSGSGPGNIATLLTLASGSGSTSTVWWSLAVSQDGSTVSLACQDGNELVPCLSAPVAFQAGNWVLVALGYSETNTAIFINNAMVASGGGLPAVPAQVVPSTSLIVGSGVDGQHVAVGQIDELSVFSGSNRFRRMTGSPFGLDTQNSISDYYNAYSPTAALGPITPEAEAARRTQRMTSRAMRLDSSGPPAPGEGGGSGGSGGTSPPISGWAYTDADLWVEIAAMTNSTGFFVVHPPAAEAADAVYDLLMTTNLSPNVPGLNLTNWLWLMRTDPGQTNILMLDLTADQAYFMLARTNDADGDLLSDAIERLVSHTDPNVPDPNLFPVVISQPVSQTVVAGDTVTFTVEAGGTLPLNYQWQFTDTGGTATNVSAANGPSLTLNNVQSGTAGSYRVRVSNRLGSTVSSNAVLTVQSSSEYAMVLVGPRQDYRFKGDTTYYVDGSAGPVELYGTTVIEGGAVIKYGTNAGATLVLKGPVVTQTGPYSPAIFTAQDDDLVGWPILASTGIPTNYYATAALELASATDSVLRYLRIAYAQTAVQYTGATNHQISDTVQHAQILHCGTAFLTEGTTNYARVLNLGNVLISDVSHAIGGSHFQGTAQHLTVDACNLFAADDSSSALGFEVTNSIFSNVTGLGQGLGLDGSNNGFYPDSGPQFGSSPMTDDQSPFALTCWVDGQGNAFYNFENGQGAYYLREDSPFAEAGTSNVEPALKTDFAQMTTAVPPEVLFDDINSSLTLDPTAPRDPEATSLGYHYPAVDYVINGVTVNNATLNVGQGTVLASQGWPFSWGIRLNPGGRLNVNGVPSNRVVFAHLEAVQESPVWDLEPYGPTITWKELYLWTGPPAPFPEAKVHYTDFPTLSGAWNGHFDASSSYLSSTYSLVANLELDGCHLQGGWFVYDDGGPAGRTVNLRNTVFDRCAVDIHATSFYGDYMGVPSYSAQVTAANNLFYQCFMALSPVSGSGAGASWTFIDNLFDNVSFPTPDFYNTFLNGPVGVNHHNAYVGMSSMPNGGRRLSPPAPTSTDPDLAALNYQTGPLGRFYLPSTATNLLARGSRLAGAAGEYHFTCLTNNQKEATGQVSIGPHYLALVSGGAPDSNGDGVPDFLADRNGDGIEGADEIPWQTAPAGPLAILSPADGSTVAGLIPVRFGLGTNASAGAWVALLVDGASQLCSSGGGSPADSTAELEADTTFLANGPHTLTLRANYAQPPDESAGMSGYTVESPPIVINVTNTLRSPGWQDQAELVVKVDEEADLASADYTIDFFNSTYPKSDHPWRDSLVASINGTATNGMISYSDVPANLGFGDGDSDPNIYSFTEFTPAGSAAAQARANRNTQRTLSFPPVGLWAVSYEAGAGDYWWDCTNNVYKPTLDPKDEFGQYYFHQDHLVSWLTCALTSADGYGPIYAPPGGTKQTWPIRGDRGHAKRSDAKLLLKFLANRSIWNFYGYGHGVEGFDSSNGTEGFMGMSASELSRALKHHRYRFAFLDGCGTADSTLLSAFGADAIELPHGSDTNSGPLDLAAYTDNLRPGAFLAWAYDILSVVSLPDAVVDDWGRTCIKQKIPAFCFWRGQIAANWTRGVGYGPLELEAAIDQATSDTLAEFNPRDLQGLHFQDLKHFGYRDLGCTEYNHAGDWP